MMYKNSFGTAASLLMSVKIVSGLHWNPVRKHMSSTLDALRHPVISLQTPFC